MQCPLDQMIAAEESEELARAIQRLPETERLVLRMVTLHGISESDTARCMATPRIKVRQALARANGMLRARLA